jgi:hypothetical protein
MSEIPQLKPLLLPMAIWARLSAKTDSDDALPINLSTQLIDRVRKDPVRAERLSCVAAGIWDQHEVNQSILELSEDEMGFAERESMEQGLSLEQLLINSIVERAEDQDDDERVGGC